MAAQARAFLGREIGKRLHISHRTVAAHLAKIYAKLGATSRVQLHNALKLRSRDPVQAGLERVSLGPPYLTVLLLTC